MKKYLRIISAAVCIVILGITLCSCQYLEDKKAEHAVYCDDSKESLVFRDYTYRKAAISKDITFLTPEEQLCAYVTTEDVPVLLASEFGERLYYNNSEQNPVVMRCENTTDEIYYAYPTSFPSNMHNLRADYLKEGSAEADRVFIREDQYDTLSKAMKNAVMDSYYIWKLKYSYSYNNYSGDAEPYYSDYTVEKISDDAMNAINESLKAGKKIKYSDLDRELDGIVFTACDKDLLFTNDYGVLLLHDKDDYYLVQLGKTGSALSNDVVKVPEEYADSIKDLYREYSVNAFSAILPEYFEEYADQTKSTTETGWGDSSIDTFV